MDLFTLVNIYSEFELKGIASLWTKSIPDLIYFLIWQQTYTIKTVLIDF